MKRRVLVAVVVVLKRKSLVARSLRNQVLNQSRIRIQIPKVLRKRKRLRKIDLIYNENIYLINVLELYYYNNKGKLLDSL